MQFKILSSLGVCVKDNGFSIDELVMRLDALFQEKGFPGIVAQILMLVDENLALPGGRRPLAHLLPPVGPQDGRRRDQGPRGRGGRHPQFWNITKK